MTAPGGPGTGPSDDGDDLTPAGEGTGGDAPLTEADVERMLAALDAVAEAPEPGTGQDAAPDAQATTAEPSQGRPGVIALVLTPVASAPALAGLCAMSGIDVDVVPTTSGAVAVLEIAAREKDEWDIGELVGEAGGPSLPPEAEDLAANLSRMSRAGVVLMTAELATDVGIESGLSGHIHARRYIGGEPDGDVPAGLVLAGADQVVEDLILGRVRAADVNGHQRSGTIPRWKAARMFTRGLRKRKP
ncbi:hypothetical protein [Georgenia yuyongxinii]|uniref:hypothetical protein n=1 Tax=Georgenia yuyongxinii TaxID=2589797 RepID=UPI00163DB501|nr:hypothetical protein [Georgenia yuyongxinii]